MATPKKTNRKPKPKPTSLFKGRATEVEVKIDAGLRNAWKAAREALVAAEREGASAFDTKWETIGDIIDHEPPLYLAGGFATPKAFLAAFVEENVRSAQRMIRVARYASPDEEMKYGVSKLDAAIAYVEAKLGAPAKRHVPIDFPRLRIPVLRDGKTTRTSLEDATVEDLRRATRDLARTSKSKTKSTASPVVAAIVGALAGARFRDVKVSVVKGRLTLSGVAIEHLVDAARALSKLKLPQPRA